MAEAVRVGEEPAKRARVEPAPARRDEESFLGAAHEAGAGLAEVELQPVRGLLAERHDAVLAPLAMYVDGFLFEVHVRQVQPHGLCARSPAE